MRGTERVVGVWALVAAVPGVPGVAWAQDAGAGPASASPPVSEVGVPGEEEELGEPEDPEASVDDEGGFGATATAVVRPRPRVATESAAAEEVTGETLRTGVEPSLVESLSVEVPYLHVTSRGNGIHGIGNGATGGLTLRGLGGSPNTQVLVVLDGAPDLQGLFGHPLPDTYLPTLVDRATVVSGASSVRWGTNALGGAVVLESRWLDDDGTELYLDSSYGSFGTATLDASVLHTDGSLSVAVGASGTTTAGHREGAGGTIAGSQAALRWRLGPRTQLVARYRIAHVDGTDPGPVSFPTPNRWFSLLRNAASFRLSHGDGPWRLAATAFATVGRNQLYDGFRGVDLVTGARLVAQRALPGGLVVRAGLAADLVDGRVRNELDPSPDPEVSAQGSVAAFEQVEWAPADWLVLDAGARQIFSFVWGFVPVFEAGASVAPWDGGRLAFRVAQGYREPTLRELYLPFPAANPDLDPERSRTIEATVEQRMDDVFRARVTVYQTHVDDLILTLGYFPTAEIRNVAEADIRGIEALVEAKPLPWLALRAGAGLVDPGVLTQQSPRRRVAGTVRLMHERVRARLTVTHVGGLYGRTHERDPLPDFVVLDARLDVPIPSTPATLYGVLRNLTDARYAYIPGYPMPPRNGAVGIRLTL